MQSRGVPEGDNPWSIHAAESSSYSRIPAWNEVDSRIIARRACWLMRPADYWSLALAVKRLRGGPRPWVVRRPATPAGRSRTATRRRRVSARWTDGTLARRLISVLGGLTDMQLWLAADWFDAALQYGANTVFPLNRLAVLLTTIYSSTEILCQRSLHLSINAVFGKNGNPGVS